MDAMNAEDQGTPWARTEAENLNNNITIKTPVPTPCSLGNES